MFTDFWRAWATRRKDDAAEAMTSVPKIIALNALDRRANLRVRYPFIGAVGGLPQVWIGDHRQLTVFDISLGGLCVVDLHQDFPETIGFQCEIRLVWPDRNVPVMVTIVGLSLNRRHLQFVDLPPQGLVRLSLLLKPGYVGSKMRQINTAQRVGKPLIAASEFWLSPSGESLAFFEEDGTSAPWIQIFLFRQNITVDRAGRLSPDSTLREALLIALSNVPLPSPQITLAIERLNGQI